MALTPRQRMERKLRQLKTESRRVAYRVLAACEGKSDIKTNIIRRNMKDFLAGGRWWPYASKPR